ncbi:DNA polymerase III subunit alpha [Streptomyces acidiscabies]|uniref:DNA polymerase III subunit alpha n=5 Tax=Streptomyces acidiscabies TaxID=42234 RepID=A0AAP6BGL3_9ACTN|nr:DNA polymerase III subunit alpha [Streptomyces acidiscabies]MBZ3916778.1 DNA polymerase III subunit alpha [Streptomyces acidiscabies]MDX2964379.1 DNA polymerase III subunit alpha [Streptomyces acidiscabies]MDX3794202.1 DNA polymerase III subunit alpha [Streptomyces acidiscabies]
MRAFTHLRTVSGYSLRYGVSHPDVLARRAVERGMDAVALTDRDSLGGAVRFAKASARAGVRPVFGVDLAVGMPVEPDGPDLRRRVRAPARGGVFVDESAPRVLFLARDGGRGWADVCRLVSAAHRGRAGGGESAVLSWEEAVGEHVMVLLGPDSDVGRALAAGRADRAGVLLERWRERFGGEALRIEVVCHGNGSGGTGFGSVRHAARSLAFAADQGVLPVLTNAVRYADPGSGPVADVLDSARRLVPIDRHGVRDSGERWLKPPQEMFRIARRVAEAAGYGPRTAHRLLEVTEETAAGCRVDPEVLGLGRVFVPEPDRIGAAGRAPQQVLREVCEAGLVRRGYDRDERYRMRMEDELALIGRLDYAGFFLTVHQVVRDTRDLGIRAAARGSAAGSLVVHLLGIAAGDPVAHGLIMERFLSEDRAELPDIDVDVESARRPEVYRAILGRFGPQRVAAVAMPETYRVRHAVRSVGLALGLDPADIDRLAKSFPHIRARDARTALRELPELRTIDPDAYGPRMWDLVEALDGLPRGMAMHPCGVIISDASLLRRTPVVPTPGAAFPMSQFDKRDVEDAGLLKVDILGVRMQSAMAYAVAETERATGRRIDLDDPAQVPADDAETFQLIQSSQTLGCFQTESPGQRDLVARLRPENLHDLVTDISLFRPGPVAADMITPLLKARAGTQPRYPHPDLEPVLRETHGVLVFHEQIIRTLTVMTGCTLAFGDYTRRALSDPGLAGRIRDWFEREARGRGYPPQTVEEVWGLVSSYAGFGFCKAHGLAFAVPSYQSAWLKAHHSAAFYAGVLTYDPGMYPKRLILADARRRGVPILPLDVNISDTAYRIELVSNTGGGGPVYGVRLALSDVRGMSDAEAERITAGRPYAALDDFVTRATPSRPVAERLVQVGALDQFGDNRRDLLLHLTELYRRHRSTSPGQLTLTDDGRAAPLMLPDMDDTERLAAELGALGLDASRHLMADHQELLEELGVVPAARLKDLPHGQAVLVAGAKSAVQTPPVRSGKRVIFTTLDDTSGVVDCAFFEDSHDGAAHTVFHSWLLLVRGVVQRRTTQGGTAVSVTGHAAWDLTHLADLRRTHGLNAVADHLSTPTISAAPPPGAERVLTTQTGFALHPWADLQPPGDPVKQRGLWHRGPGSAG